MPPRRQSDRTAYASGMAAEETACAALQADGWTVLARRIRTKAGEVDAVAEKPACWQSSK
jgi:putative endonuclease